MDLEIMILDNELVVLKKEIDPSGATYKIVHRVPRAKIMFPREWEPERYFFHVNEDERLLQTF